MHRLKSGTRMSARSIVTCSDHSASPVSSKFDFSRPAFLTMLSDVISGKSKEEQDEVTPEMPGAEAAEIDPLVAEFCSVYPASRVEPTPAELSALLAFSSSADPRVSRAIYEQLTWADGNTDWQPRLRALCVLEYFYCHGDLGKDVSNSILADAEPLLRFLASAVPQCQERATRVLELLSDELRKPQPRVIGWTQPYPRGFSPESSEAESEPWQPASAALSSRSTAAGSDGEVPELGGGAADEEAARDAEEKVAKEAFAQKAAEEAESAAVVAAAKKEDEVVLPAPPPPISTVAVPSDATAEPASSDLSGLDSLVFTEDAPATICTKGESTSSTTPERVQCQKQLRFLSLSAVDLVETCEPSDPFETFVAAQMGDMIR